jgi:zinc/manganese transport system substrate-binding protein
MSRPAVLRALPGAAVLLAAVAVAAGCGDSGNAGASSGAVPVVATTTQVADIVRAVGGSDVDVHQMLQPNTDPHEYEPRPNDVKAAANAKVVFASGDGLDHWIGDVVKQSGGSPAVVELADSNTLRLPGEAEHEDGDEGHDHGDSEYDPHWWHDPRNVVAAIPAIVAALSEANPSGKATYERNGAAYRAKVEALDQGIQACIDAVPAAERKLVTDHDAFGYFARRYGLDVVGAVIPSQTTRAQPSAKELAELVQTIRREDVKAVFPESSVNPKLAKAIARETGARADLELYGDTLGPKGSSGATYLTMEQANADALVNGFTGGKQHCAIPGIGAS